MGLLAAMTASPCLAQAPASAATPIDPRSYPGAIALDGPGRMPVAGASDEVWVARNGNAIVRNVSRPLLIPVLPDPAKATGAAVIIAPGGAFISLAIDHEGMAVARWLAERGVAAFVLKYRTEQGPTDPVAFGAFMQDRMKALQPGGTPRPASPGEAPAAADAAAAIRLVRADAAKFGIDRTRVGMLGFSAGARTALNLTIKGDPADRPDFIAPIYPPMMAVKVPAKAPPMFLAIAADDPLYGGMGIGLYDSWRASGSPTELHLYENGGHGFGMIPTGKSSQHWIDQFYWWMQARGLLVRK